MKNLREILKAIDIKDTNESYASIAIKGISAHSSRIEPGFLFVAKKGATPQSADGHNFIDDAVARGAHAILVENSFSPKKVYSIPIIKAPNSTQAYAYLCEAFYDFPSKKLCLIGITGTNGKTSTSFMLYSIFKAAGFEVRIMGTLGMGEPHKLAPLSHTTMEAEFISQSLSNFVHQGVDHVVMEVSSHALALDRVAALHFSAVGLSNISQDHLDFHGTMEEYTASKAKLFWQLAKNQTQKILPIKHPFCTSTHELQNLSFYSATEPLHFKLPLAGDFHQQNANLAFFVAKSLGLDRDSIKKGLEQCPAIPGRFEVVARHPCKIIVDFAHTPEALENILRSLKNFSYGRLIVVMGCGGNRDKSKRPMMGHIAHKWADFVIVTDDNPRNEKPQQIRADIMTGMPNSNKAYNIGDRAQAIHEAIKLAQADDIVLIVGKGHENYQLYGNDKRAFCDKLVAQKIAESLCKK
ncbi:MAG: UDP-N-acetylmuramoyl-L-alanyl-D-glutamate--2,6-diaminopimelate ligase [Myxococcales bacterium]|nr:UDP-N-acetylmuramoyl-L-alanyl-D-glutamate--2,6-diaminopimelate ligase [Myxococcales bacterium]USN51296.1 MAG: UDP-N-acetylmuramoyl-L-alanyl-D-glutamate--2,6-diaminopimelate ligase [Myxococcales bacterium]